MKIEISSISCKIRAVLRRKKIAGKNKVKKFLSAKLTKEPAQGLVPFYTVRQNKANEVVPLVCNERLKYCKMSPSIISKVGAPIK
jgi:hypothetical protein